MFSYFKQTKLARVLPMYVAAYAVLLCGLGSYLNSNSDDAFGARGVAVVLAGFCVSLTCRLRQWRQNTMFGILAGMVVVLIFWVTVSGIAPSGVLLNYLAAGRNNGPGMMLAWFLMLYSFAMIADEVIVFSVVPSMALLGLMASENLNPEMVVYFLGLVLSAVFLLVYENMLSRGVFDAPDETEPSARSVAGNSALVVPGAMPSAATLSGLARGGKDGLALVRPAVKTSLLLAMVVMALALVVGFGASVPLQVVGKEISDRTPQLNMPVSPETAAEVQSRYVNQLQLSGAPPHLSDRIVLHVYTPRPFYWRGKVFDYYTGSSWTTGETIHDLSPARFGNLDTKPLDNQRSGEAMGRELVLQRFKTFDPPLSGEMVTAAEPVRVLSSAPVRQDAQRCLRMPEGRAQISYRVFSMVPVATPDQLRKAGSDFPQLLQYMNTEKDDDNATRAAIAHSITDRFHNEYDKAKALESYLQDNFTYTLTPPRTPSSEDAVTFFLTQSKQGYCEIFASAMAMLCRELKIPARLATGFAPGEWHADPNNPNRGMCVVREKDLHAWTEVYFPGYGWVPFDPTSSRDTSPSWSAAFREFFQGLAQQFLSRSFGPSMVLLVMAAIGAFLLKAFVWDVARSSAWWRALRPARGRGADAGEQCARLYERACRRVKQWAGPKSAAQTPFEYADDVRAALPSSATVLWDALTLRYVHSAYHRGGPAPADAADLERLDAQLKETLKTVRKPEAVTAASVS